MVNDGCAVARRTCSRGDTLQRFKGASVVSSRSNSMFSGLVFGAWMSLFAWVVIRFA